MIPENVMVKKANLHLSVYDPEKAAPIWNMEVCFDERTNPKRDGQMDKQTELQREAYTDKILD